MAGLTPLSRNGSARSPWFSTWFWLVICGVFSGVGLLLVRNAADFEARSVPAQVSVADMFEKREGRKRRVKSELTVETTEGATVSYVGSSWHAPKRHEVGDVVPGRYDAATGEIRTDRMLAHLAGLGRMFLSVGGAIAFVGVFMLVDRTFFMQRRPSDVSRRTVRSAARPRRRRSSPP